MTENTRLRGEFDIMVIVNVIVSTLRVTVALILFSLLMGACQQQEAVESSRWPHSSPVKISSILLKEVQESVTLVGTVEPLKRSLVASEIAGLVEEYPLNEGDLVHKGELLARLRTDTIEIQMKEAVARRREAIARYRKAKFQLNRTRELFRTGTASRQQFEDDEAEELALYERLTQQESKIREYQDQLRMAKILAPFDGWIIEEYSELGQWVAKGGPVVEMLDLSHVQVEVPLPERYVNEVKLADFVVVRFDAVPLREFTGKIFSIVAQANPETRTFPIKIDIPNPDGLIKSGMFSRITLTVGEPYHAMLLPKDAVVLRGGEKFVVVVDEGVATQVAIQSGQHVNHLVEVTGDLSEGMDVVVQGNERLSTGQKVTVIQ